MYVFLTALPGNKKIPVSIEQVTDADYKVISKKRYSFNWKYGIFAAVSLVPKTLLRQYYMDKYGFEQAGVSLYMEGRQLIKLLKEYDYD